MMNEKLHQEEYSNTPMNSKTNNDSDFYEKLGFTVGLFGGLLL